MIDAHRRRGGAVPGVEHVGDRLARRGVSADRLTFGGLATAGVAAGLVIAGHPVYGGCVLGLSALFDVLDGTVARRTGTASRRGAFLDSMVDRVVDAGMLIATGWWLIARDQRLAAGLAVGALAFSMLVSYARARAESLGGRADGGLMERAERTVLLAIGLAFPALILPVLAALCGLTALTAYGRVVAGLRSLPGPVADPAPPALAAAEPLSPSQRRRRVLLWRERRRKYLVQRRRRRERERRLRDSA